MYDICLVITNSMLIFKRHMQSWKIKFLFPWKMQYLEERSNSSFRINFKVGSEHSVSVHFRLLGFFLLRISYMGY